MTPRARRDPEPPGANGPADRSEEAIRRELDRIVLESLPPIATGLAVLYAIFAVAHWLLLPPSRALPLTVSAASSAAMLGALRLSMTRWSPPPALAHPVGAAIAVVVLGNSLLHLYTTGEPRQTTNLLLLVLGVGIVFLDGGWFAAVATLAFIGWVGVLPTVSADADWLHFGFALVGASILAAAVLVIRTRTFRRIEELHFEDRMKQLELESALARTEVARKGEREAREALEDAVRDLRESEERFRRLANASYEGVVIQQDEAIVDANARAARLFGLRTGSLVGRSLGELVVEEDARRVVDFLRGAVEPDREAIMTDGLRESGDTFSLEVRRATATHKGRDAYVGVLRDATEKVEVEKMLRRAAAEAQATSRAKSSFLANMSHELRTPLNSVIGFAKVLRKKSADHLGEKELGYLDRIVSNGELLLELIGDVLDLSKVEAGRMEATEEPVELERVVREAVRTVEIQAHNKGLELRVDVPSELRNIETDPYRLRQILVNLLGNGVKFTDEGFVEVGVEADDEGRPRKIHVRDTGPGISEERRVHIFDAFQQADNTTARRYGGTGLGLTISRAMADTLGFSLSVVSELGEGTTFTIALGGPGGVGSGRVEPGKAEQGKAPEATSTAGTPPSSQERAGGSPDS